MATAPAQAASGAQQTDSAGNLVIIDSVEVNTTEVADGAAVQVTTQWHVDGRAKPDITVTIDVPDPFKGVTAKFAITSPEDEPIGRCHIVADKATCVIENRQYINDNSAEFNGEFEFSMSSELDNTETVEKTVVLGGREVPFNITPNTSKCFEDCSFKGIWPGKGGWYHNADMDDPDSIDVVDWWVNIEADRDGLKPDLRVSVTDPRVAEDFELLGARVEYAYSTYIDKNNREQLAWNVLSYAHSGAENNGVTWSKDNTEVSFTTMQPKTQSDVPSGPGRELLGGVHYQVVWSVAPKDLGKAKTYKNEASYTINGESSGELQGTAVRYSYSGRAVGKNFGRVELTKQLTGDTAFNPARTFEVTIDAYDDAPTDGSGSRLIDSKAYTLQAGGKLVSEEYYTGTRLVITEKPVTGPANVEWGTPKFEDTTRNVRAEGNVYEVVLSKENNNLGKISEVTLTNHAELRTAKFAAHKSVINPDEAFVPSSQVYKLNYHYDANGELGFPAGSGTLDLTADGKLVTSDAVPVGATIRLAEAEPSPVPAASWTARSVVPNTFTVTDAEGTTPVATVAVENTIARNYGSFSITKAVSGTGEELIPEGTKYEVSYAYAAGDGFAAGGGNITLVAGGAPVIVDKLPAGALVKLSEAAPDPITGTSWLGAKFSATEFPVISGTQVEISLENDFELNTGDFSVQKKIDGDGSDLVANDTPFVVNYSYPEGKGFSAGEGTLVVPANGEAVTSGPLPFGAQVTLNEAPADEVLGGTWTGHRFNKHEFTIGDKTSVAVELTNSIHKNRGSFSVVKSISGSGSALVAPDTTFNVRYSYPAGPSYDAFAGELTVAADGTPTTIHDIPAGALVTIQEAQPAAIVGGTWGEPEYAAGTQTVIADGETHELSIENKLERNSGAFSVVKEVTGSGAKLVAPETTYTIRYSFAGGDGFEAGSGSLSVKADGRAVTSTPIPFGAEVSLEEELPPHGEGFTWGIQAFSSESVVIGDGTVTAVTLTNTADATPDKLSNTGATVLWPALGAAALLAAGGALLIAKRFRKETLS